MVNAGVGLLTDEVEISLPEWLPEKDSESFTSRSAGKNAVPGSDRHYDFMKMQTLGDEFLYLRNPDMYHYVLEAGKGLYLTADSVLIAWAARWNLRRYPVPFGIRSHSNSFA